MRLFDLIYRTRDRIIQTLYYLRFNPTTEAGRQAILNEMQRQAVQMGEKIEIPTPGKGQVQSPSDPSHQPLGTQSPIAPSPIAQPPISQSPVAQSGQAIPSAPAYPPPADPYQGYQGGTGAEHVGAYPPVRPLDTPGVGTAPASGLYSEYRCLYNDPLSCDEPHRTVREAAKAKFCSKCGFPAPLPEKLEIRGRRGTYQVGSFLGRRGLGRLYGGTQIGDPQPLVIKEYLLPPRSFANPEDRRLRQEAFIRVANINAADGRVQDFRLLLAWEAIADDQVGRCYLITKGELGNLPTLQSVAARQPMRPEQIRRILAQGLQTLEFLHGQKFRLGSGQIRTGLTHGRLSLQSLLISEQPQDFFIYLCDLSIWEDLFNPAVAMLAEAPAVEDLTSLGRLGFHLQAGRTFTPAGDPLDPADERNWLCQDAELQRFLMQLMGLRSRFETATAARQALLRLPAAETGDSIVKLEDDQELAPKRKPWWLLLLAALLLLGGIAGALGWFLLGRKPAEDGPALNLVCCINRVPNVPGGRFTYAMDQPGTASFVLEQTQPPLAQELMKAKPDLQLESLAAPEPQQALTQVETSKAAFAITSAPSDLRTTLTRATIAFDGLFIFVPFSYEKRQDGLPAALQGKLTLEQVRQLFTGKIQNWRELGGPDVPVKLYAPTEASAISAFEQLVLKTSDQISVFRSLLAGKRIQRLETLATIQDLQRKFEVNKEGGIGFGLVSKVFNQCGAYPLALSDGSTAPQQGLQQNDSKLVSPETDLCAKGSYHINEPLFRDDRYPLVLPLAVFYPQDNRDDPQFQIGKKLSEMLLTRQGQLLLRDVNLVPLYPIPR